MHKLKENWFKIGVIVLLFLCLYQLIEIREELYYLNYTTFNKLSDITDNM
jgi:hypothetical protein